MNELLEKLNGMTFEDLREWLQDALNGQEFLPRLAQDEAPHHSISRLEKQLERRAADNLREAHQRLLVNFLSKPEGDENYGYALLGLLAEFHEDASIERLANFADCREKFTLLSLPLQQAILGRLVDLTPARPKEFWMRKLEQNPQGFAMLAFSGVLSTNPLEALDLLGRLPQNQMVGEAAALILDLKYMNFDEKLRPTFASKIAANLAVCEAEFSKEVDNWLRDKLPEIRRPKEFNPTLMTGLKTFWGNTPAPRFRNARLVAAHP